MSESRAERIAAFRARLEQRRRDRPKTRQCVSAPPRYDDVYWQGVAWLDAIARGDICEECGGERVDTDGLAEHKCECVGVTG